MFKRSKYIVIIIWIVLLATLCFGSLNGVTRPSDEFYFDKFAHFAVFALLSFIPTLFVKNTKWLFCCLLFLIAIGGGIEIVQNEVPGRSGSLYDFISDIAGVIGGVFIYKFYNRLKN